MAPEEGVTITLREIYDKLVRIEESVRVMDAPLQTVTDHESRIRGLERWRYSQPVTLVMSVASIVITLRSTNP